MAGNRATRPTRPAPSARTEAPLAALPKKPPGHGHPGGRTGPTAPARPRDVAHRLRGPRGRRLPAPRRPEDGHRHQPHGHHQGRPAHRRRHARGPPRPADRGLRPGARLPRHRPGRRLRGPLRRPGDGAAGLRHVPEERAGPRRRLHRLRRGHGRLRHPGRGRAFLHLHLDAVRLHGGGRARGQALRGARPPEPGHRPRGARSGAAQGVRHVRGPAADRAGARDDRRGAGAAVQQGVPHHAGPPGDGPDDGLAALGLLRRRRAALGAAEPQHAHPGHGVGVLRHLHVRGHQPLRGTGHHPAVRTARCRGRRRPLGGGRERTGTARSAVPGGVLRAHLLQVPGDHGRRGAGPCDRPGRLRPGAHRDRAAGDRAEGVEGVRLAAGRLDRQAHRIGPGAHDDRRGRRHRRGGGRLAAGAGRVPADAGGISPVRVNHAPWLTSLRRGTITVRDVSAGRGSLTWRILG
ncbi:hypothetical protein SGPA1_20114 [Streptomyces misionensis JCM 4497]